MSRRVSFLAVLLYGVLRASAARADAPVAPTLPSPAAASAAPAAPAAADAASLSAPARAKDPNRVTFALVVTNNKSLTLSRPDLRYADDDGAKYYELFRMLAPEENVSLLTTFDRDTSRAFPDLGAKVVAPEKRQVLARFADVARRVGEAKAAGKQVDFYFVFAGHGDVDQGKGFLELEGGRLVSDELEALVRAVPSTRTHVILDSCNAFFVLNARKPGGRRFATGAEAGERLNHALPNVGVFLSTSAEAETFEWSELGAGIFSHAVRSGLSGAADANADGDVTYEELAAFVATASKRIKNARFRPNVFARGPSGRSDEPLFRTRYASGKRFTVEPTFPRLTLRDADEVPWIDAHFEAGAARTLVIPARVAQNATLDVVDGSGAHVRHPTRVNDDVLAVEASTANTVLAARGPGDLFRNLFADPFGPKALAEYKDGVAREPPPVYGVAAEDVARMNELLFHAAETARASRQQQALGLAGLAALYGGTGAILLAGGRDESRSLGTTTLVGSAAPLVFAGWSLLRSSREEKDYAWFRGARGVPSADFMAEAEAKLFALARRDREERRFWRVMGSVVGGIYTSAMLGATIALASSDDNRSVAGLAAVATVGVGLGFALPVIGTFSPTYTERMAEIWLRDPSRLKDAPSPRETSSFTIRPTFAGSGVGLGGTF